MKCSECGKKIEEEQRMKMCSGCEDFFCYNTGCMWLTERDGLYICEECLPEETCAAFIIKPSEKRIVVNETKSLSPGQSVREAIEILKEEGYIHKYQIDRGEKSLIKFGKDCGLYFLSDSEGIKVNGIGIWSGAHKTDEGIAIYSSKEEVREVYGEAFEFEELDDYNSKCVYKNITFFSTRVGPKREIVMEIFVF